MKFMNMKRFGAAVMGGVMALSMASPAFATANVEITGTYEEMEIAVVVTDSGEAQINPYGLPVEITKSDRTAPKATISGEQITAPVMAIRNQSSVPLDVGVSSFTVKPTGGLIIKGSALTTTGSSADKGKQAHVELEVAGLNDATLSVPITDKIDDKLIDKHVAEATWSGLAPANKLAAPAAASPTATITPAKTAANAPLATLGATKVNGDGKTVYSAKSIALFRLKGHLTSDPEKTESGSQVPDPWATGDGFTAQIAFTFKPAAKHTITVNATGGTAAASPTTAWEGTQVTISATPTTAGQTATFVVTDSSSNTIANTNGVFTMPDDNVTVTVSFS